MIKVHCFESWLCARLSVQYSCLPLFPCISYKFLFYPSTNLTSLFGAISCDVSEHKSSSFLPPVSSVGVCTFIKVTFLNFVFILRVHFLSFVDLKPRMFPLLILSTTKATPNLLLCVFFPVFSSVWVLRLIIPSPYHLVSCMAISCMLYCCICGMNSFIHPVLIIVLTFLVPNPNSLESS